MTRATCPGKRTAASGGRLIGICLLCSNLRTAAPSYSLPPAAQQNQRRVWVCANWSAE